MKYSQAFFTHTEYSIHLGQGQGQHVFIQNNFLFKFVIHVKNKVKIFLYFAPINNKEPKMLFRMAIKLIFTLITFTILIYPIKCVSNP